MDPVMSLAVSIIFMSILFLPTIIITSYSFYQLCIQDSSEWINKSYRDLTIIIMIAFTLTGIFDLIHVTMVYIPYSTDPNTIIFNNTNTEEAIAMTASFIYFVGNIAFYLLILLRIALPFQLNKYISFTFGFFIFAFAVSAAVYIAGFKIFDAYKSAWDYVTGALAVCDVILSVFILILFVYKMRQTVNNIDPSLSKEAEQNVNLMVNVIAKHVLLFGSSIILNQGFYVAIQIQVTAPRFTIANFYCAPFVIRAVENFANVTVLWLMLRANYDRYIKICRSCHICIGRCCFKNIDSKVVSANPYKRLGDDL